MNQSPPSIQPTPPPINRQDQGTSQTWLVVTGIACLVFFLMLLLLFALILSDKSGGQASSSTGNKSGTSSPAPAVDTGQDEANEIDLPDEQADSITSQEQPEPQPDTAPSSATPTVETEDEDLSTNQSAKINNSLELSSTGRQFFGNRSRL